MRESIVPSNGKKRLDLPVQKNILTNYFCLASLEAKRKFRAPKLTPKQQILNKSSLSSPQTEATGAPDSIEDTSSPAEDMEASQFSSEHISSGPPEDDSINASQYSSEHFSCDFPRDGSASVSPHCSSRDIGSDPPSEDPGTENTEVQINYCNGSTIPASWFLERTSPGMAKPYSDLHNMETRQTPHYTESNVAPANRNIAVRSSYFKKDKRVYTNPAEDEDNCETGNIAPFRYQLRNPVDVLKRRKLHEPQTVEDEIMQPTSSHESPPVDEGCDADSFDGINTNSEGRFGCNVTHVNKYSGIAEKSMDKFAALISSFRYAGSRASGLRPPLKDVKNTLTVRSVLRPPEQKTARLARSQDRFASDAADTADLRTFAYRPTNASPDQMKTRSKAADSPIDLSAFAYTPAITTASRPNGSKSSSATADSPPDLNTFAYKATKSTAKLAATTLKAAGRTSRGRFT